MILDTGSALRNTPVTRNVFGHRPAVAKAMAGQAHIDSKDKSFRQDLQDVQDISRPFPPIKSGVTRGIGSAKKTVGGRIAQEARFAGDLMSEHQGIFGEQRATKISELVFVPIDSPKILLSDYCIQSMESCASYLIKFSESLKAL
jgi:hypothetical protein